METVARERESEERGEGPVRTCVGCRAEAGRDALVRFVLAGDPPRLLPDPEHRLPGRGASVHPRRDCLEKAATRGGFSRSFGTSVSADARELSEMLRTTLHRRVDALHVAARRAGHAAIGTEAVRSSLGGPEHERPRLLVVAADAAGRREDFEAALERLGGSTVVYRDKAELGRLFGRDEVGVVGLVNRGIAGEVAEAVARIAELTEDE